tara:strand:+ start:223 stop:696 length:474 start_codon:yes stop_codon:yes gene_type:complete
MGTTRYGTRLSIKKSQLDSIGGGSSVDNESFRADQVYMNMVNKSGGTIAKGIMVRHVDGTVTGVQPCNATTGKATVGVTLASSANDAAVQVAYGGKAQVLVAGGVNLSEGEVFKPDANGKASVGGGGNAFGYLLEDGDQSGGGDALKWASILIAEQG